MLAQNTDDTQENPYSIDVLCLTLDPQIQTTYFPTVMEHILREKVHEAENFITIFQVGATQTQTCERLILNH